MCNNMANIREKEKKKKSRECYIRIITITKKSKEMRKMYLYSHKYITSHRKSKLTDHCNFIICLKKINIK
jgi:hypothetical protein